MKYDFETVNKRYGSGSRKWDQLERCGLTEKDDIIPFSVADMEFRTAPEIKEALFNEIENEVLGYSNPTAAYLQSVCDWMKKRHDWEIRPEWILPSHGVVDLLFYAVKTYTKEGDGIILMTPVYYPMYHAVRDTGRVLMDNRLIRTEDSYEIDFEDLEKKAADENTKMLILCSPHNPCGRVWKKEELKKISEICLKNNVLVVSDEIHFDLIMPGYEHTVYAKISEEAAQNCIICTAPSKTFNLAGLQTSNIIIPNDELRAQYFHSLQLTNPNPKCNILGYRACEAAYKNCAEWLDEVIGIIDTNRKLIIDFLAKEFPEIKVVRLEGTYLLWMDWSSLGYDAKELERKNTEEARLFFDEGYIFGDQGSCYERWNLACPTRYIEEALERMKAVYKK